MIKLGSNNIGKIYLGSNSIGKAYLGSNLVFQKGGGPSPVLPYTPVEYIETDGVAYINTGILGNDPRSAEIKFTPTLKAYQIILGTTNGTDGNAKTYVLFQIGSAGTLNFSHYYNYSSGAPSIQNSIDNATPFVAKNSLNSGSQVLQVKQEGESSFTSFSQTYGNTVTTDNPMYLFANYKQSIGGADTKCNTGSKLYYCKIYSDSTYTTLVRDFVPCVYQGEYGMWDNVSDTFFGNAAGSGAFTGPSIS